MALKAAVTTEEYGPLDDATKALYVDKADKDFHVLAVEAVSGYELVGGNLRKALQTERQRAKEAAEKLEAFKDLDPDAARDALKKVEEWTANPPDPKDKDALANAEKRMQAQFDAQRKQLVENHAKEVERITGELKSTGTQLHESLVDTRAVMAIESAGGIPKLLLPVVKNEAFVEKDGNGRFQVRIRAAEGGFKLTQKPGGGDTPMDINEFVESLRTDKDFAHAFKASSANGSGASGGNSNARTGPVTISRADARDNTKYMAALKAAEKAGQPLITTDA